jgi:hypothetical protein
MTAIDIGGSFEQRRNDIATNELYGQGKKYDVVTPKPRHASAPLPPAGPGESCRPASSGACAASAAMTAAG